MDNQFCANPSGLTAGKPLDPVLNKIFLTSASLIIVTVLIVGVSHDVVGSNANVLLQLHKSSPKGLLSDLFGLSSLVEIPNGLIIPALKDQHLEDVLSYWAISLVISLCHYYGIGGFLYWYYYVYKRDQYREWKSQPNSWATAESIRHSILLGNLNLLLVAIFWGTLVCYIRNGGWSRVYFNISDYGWMWFIIQLPIAFIYQDYLLYWDHRMFHTPFLYKLTHKVHHRYKQPTAFVGLAAHPVEVFIPLLISASLFFLFPIHWITLVIIPSYHATYALLDHSGVKLKAQWWQPWQPDTIFHDDHHKYTHCNFGANIKFWDQIHGTSRKSPYESCK